MVWMVLKVVTGDIQSCMLLSQLVLSLSVSFKVVWVANQSLTAYISKLVTYMLYIASISKLVTFLAGLLNTTSRLQKQGGDFITHSYSRTHYFT